jgi:predicted DNA-binding transcriptional regulator AlpA
MADDIPELLTFEDVSRITKIKVNTLRKWVTNKQIPNVKVNGAIRFCPGEIKDWLAKKNRGIKRDITPDVFKD